MSDGQSAAASAFFLLINALLLVEHPLNDFCCVFYCRVVLFFAFVFYPNP
jgi:hypothetical protein